MRNWELCGSCGERISFDGCSCTRVMPDDPQTEEEMEKRKAEARKLSALGLLKGQRGRGKGRPPVNEYEFSQIRRV